MSSAIPDYIGMAQQADKAGMQDAQGMAGLMERGFKLGSQMDDRDRMKQARDAFQGAWNSGNPEDVQRVMAAFPEYAAKIQQLIGVRDDQHRKDVGSMAVNLSGLLDSGNIQGAQEYISQHKNLFDPSGVFSAGSVVNALGEAAKDSQKLGMWKDWAKKLMLSTLNPKEITDWASGQQKLGLDAQRIANEYELGGERINLQRELGNQRNQLGWARMNDIDNYHEQILKRGTPGEREWEFFNNLPPEQQAQYLNMKRGPGSGGVGIFQGPQSVKLANGQTVDIDPKVHGSGSNAFYQGRDANGKLINVPVNTVVTPVSSAELAGQQMLGKDLASLLYANQSDLEHITGYARGGGVGNMPFGADTYTGYKGGSARDAYSAAKRIQGNMQNKGVAAAKEMGASGINTVAEAKMYFQSMPQLDFSSPDSLISSAQKIKEYTEQYNQQHGVKYASGTGKDEKNGARGMSDEELLKGL